MANNRAASVAVCFTFRNKSIKYQEKVICTRMQKIENVMSLIRIAEFATSIMQQPATNATINLKS